MMTQITFFLPIKLFFKKNKINYLDDHDVNAFHLYVNEDPFLLCTAMSHTPYTTTKANTCFTAGTTFLEKGDEIYIR